MIYPVQNNEELHVLKKSSGVKVRCYNLVCSEVKIKASQNKKYSDKVQILEKLSKLSTVTK